MSKFYIEDTGQLYGCFRCGKIMGKLHRLVDDHLICGECNENGIVSFVQALDLLNDHYLKHELEPMDDQEYLDLVKELEGIEDE